MGQNKRLLVKEAAKRGREFAWRDHKEMIARFLADDDLTQKHEQSFLSPEELLMMDGATTDQARPPEPKRKLKFKQTFVTYFGSFNQLEHGAPGKPWKIAFKRGVAMNLYHELWRLSREFKEDPDLLKRVADEYAEYYTMKAKSPGSDWHVQTKMLGVPVQTVNKDSRTFSLQIRDLLDQDWERVIADIRQIKTGRSDIQKPFMEVLTYCYDLESAGQNRKTLMSFIHDEMAAANGRDARQRETSD